MKKQVFRFASVLLLSSVFVLVSSCKKDSDFDDGSGIEVSMRNGNNGDTYININGHSLNIGSDNNFYYRGYFGNEYNYSEDGYKNIASVGSVGGLSSIKSIPTSGWAQTVAVNPGHGYVLRSNDGYARVYVKKWLYSAENTSAIIGASVVYEEDWKP